MYFALFSPPTYFNPPINVLFPNPTAQDPKMCYTAYLEGIPTAL